MTKSEDCYHLGTKALIQNEKGDILVLKTNPQMLRGNAKAHWDLPGGRVQRGETPEQTLIREVQEETGVKALRVVKPLAMVLSNIRIPLEPADVGLVLAVYQCEIEPDAEIRLSKEHTDMGWFAPGEAAALLEVKYPKELTVEIGKLALS